MMLTSEAMMLLGRQASTLPKTQLETQGLAVLSKLHLGC